MSKPFKFYYDLMSPPSRALYIFFEYNKIICEKIPVALRKGKFYYSIYVAKSIQLIECKKGDNQKKRAKL